MSPWLTARKTARLQLRLREDRVLGLTEQRSYRPSSGKLPRLLADDQMRSRRLPAPSSWPSGQSRPSRFIGHYRATKWASGPVEISICASCSCAASRSRGSIVMTCLAHRLGNLVLLRADDNISIGNKPWAVKQPQQMPNPSLSKLVVPDSFSGRLLMLLNERGGERQQHMSRVVAVLDHLTMAMNGMTFPSG